MNNMLEVMARLKNARNLDVRQSGLVDSAYFAVKVSVVVWWRIVLVVVVVVVECVCVFKGGYLQGWMGQVIGPTGKWAGGRLRVGSALSVHVHAQGCN